MHIITPENAHSNKYRNRHFVKRLIREADSSNNLLTVTLTKKMLHGKLIIRDNKTIRIGSQNMAMDSSVVHDTVMETSAPAVYRSAVDTLNRQLAQTETREYVGVTGMKKYNAEQKWLTILAPSRLEWLASKSQTITVLLRTPMLRKIRQTLTEKQFS